MLTYREFAAIEAAGGDLFADDVCADKVILAQAEAHLLQDEADLLLLLHGPKRLDLTCAGNGV